MLPAKLPSLSSALPPRDSDSFPLPPNLYIPGCNQQHTANSHRNASEDLQIQISATIPGDQSASNGVPSKSGNANGAESGAYTQTDFLHTGELLDEGRGQRDEAAGGEAEEGGEHYGEGGRVGWDPES